MRKSPILLAMEKFRDAAYELHLAWEALEEDSREEILMHRVGNYPFSKDFTEVDSDIRSWVESFKEEELKLPIEVRYGFARTTTEDLEGGWMYEVRVYCDRVQFYEAYTGGCGEVNEVPMNQGTMRILNDLFVFVPKSFYDLYEGLIAKGDVASINLVRAAAHELDKGGYTPNA